MLPSTKPWQGSWSGEFLPLPSAQRGAEGVVEGFKEVLHGERQSQGSSAWKGGAERGCDRVLLNLAGDGKFPPRWEWLFIFLIIRKESLSLTAAFPPKFVAMCNTYHGLIQCCPSVLQSGCLVLRSPTYFLGDPTGKHLLVWNRLD